MIFERISRSCAVALALFVLFLQMPTAYAACAPGYGLCSDGTCAPMGSVCCGNGRNCPSGSICLPDGQHCLPKTSPRMCGNGHYCTNANDKCIFADGDYRCGNQYSSYCSNSHGSWCGGETGGCCFIPNSANADAHGFVCCNAGTQCVGMGGSFKCE
jgi:hypothetical protein